MTSRERLVYMANQIARNFMALGADRATAATADHIAKFWDPRMKALLHEHAAAGGAGLSAEARGALIRLQNASVRNGDDRS